MGLACSPLLGITMRVGKLVGFRVTATQVCARSLSVLAGKWTPPKDLWHTGFACWLESRRPRATCADVTLYGGQFMLSTQLITLKYPVMLSHWRSTKVFVENYLLYSSAPLRDCRLAGISPKQKANSRLGPLSLAILLLCLQSIFLRCCAVEHGMFYPFHFLNTVKLHNFEQIMVIQTFCPVCCV